MIRGHGRRGAETGRRSSRRNYRAACRLHEDKNVEMVIVGLVVVLSVLTWLFYKVTAGLQVKK